MTTATSKYASIRKDIAKGTIMRKFDPNEKHWNSKNQLVTYSSEASFRKAMEKEYKRRTEMIDKAENVGLPVEGRVRITWTSRAGIYGYQARAYLTYSYLKNGRLANEQIETGYTTGIGYDKESTAAANAFNESPSMVKILLDARAKKDKPSYGASLNNGKPFIPHWNGGVGLTSIISTLNDYGYNAKYEYTGTSDVTVVSFSKKRKTAAEKGVY